MAGPRLAVRPSSRSAERATKRLLKRRPARPRFGLALTPEFAYPGHPPRRRPRYVVGKEIGRGNDHEDSGRNINRDKCQWHGKCVKCGENRILVDDQQMQVVEFASLAADRDRAT